jgi:quercetin dioxygenase-like cupin family protein
MMVSALKRHLLDCPAWRISPGDSNVLAIVFDPRDEGCELVAVLEIFEVGGRTPPNQHPGATEFFFVLHGQGRASANGQWTTLARGDALMVPRGVEHVIENTGSDRLYCLTIMQPDEDFSRLIRSGTPAVLDEADRLVLGAAR